jgi:hypothetical protein
MGTSSLGILKTVRIGIHPSLNDFLSSYFFITAKLKSSEIDVHPNDSTANDDDARNELPIPVDRPKDSKTYSLPPKVRSKLIFGPAPEVAVSFKTLQNDLTKPPEQFQMNLQFGSGRNGGTLPHKLNETFDIMDEMGSQGFDPPFQGTTTEDTLRVEEVEDEVMNTEDILGSGSMTPVEVFLNPETGDYGKNPLCPELFECADPVAVIVEQLAFPQV